MTQYLDLSDPEPAFALRGRQQEFLDTLDADLPAHGRCLFVAPGGIGKSTIFAALAARYLARGKKTLILINRDGIARQSAGRIAKETGIEADIEMGASHASPYAPIVVASVQTLGRLNRLTSFADDHFGLVVSDECLPATALIDGKPISEIRVGELVKSWNHATRSIEARLVKRLFKNPAKRLIKIHCNDGILCLTESHPIFTVSGYRRAHSIREGDFIAHENLPVRLREISFEGRPFFATEEAELPVVQEDQRFQSSHCAGGSMQALRRNSEVQREKASVHVTRGTTLQSGLLLDHMSRPVGETEFTARMWREDRCVQSTNCERENEGKESGSHAGGDRKNREQVARADIPFEGGQWTEHEAARGALDCAWRSSNGVSDPDYWSNRRMPPGGLQGGHRRTVSETCYRSGWRDAQGASVEVSGCQKAGGIGFSRVDRIEILEPGSGSGFEQMCPDGHVYNFEVEGNNNYFANGFLVHNCHFSMADGWQRIMRYFHFGAASLAEDWIEPEQYEPKALIAAFTATPDIGERRSLGQFYRHVSVNYSYIEAVDEGWLVAPKQVSIPVKVDLRGYKTRATPTGMDYATGDLARAMEPIIEELADQCVRLAADRKAMHFLPSVECARMMSDALCRRGLPSVMVSGACVDGDEKTEWFKAQRGGCALCNAQIYSYGIDFPDVNCIGWFRATLSRAFYIQGVYRASRVLPGVIDGLDTAEARLAAIAASAKPDYLILDPLFVHDRIDLCDAYDLFTERPEVKAQMKEEGELSTEAAKRGERDFLKALAKEMRKQERKRARVFDPLEYALSLGEERVANYVPVKPWEFGKVTPAQLSLMRNFHVDVSKVMNTGHANKILNIIMARRKAGRANPLQLDFLKKLGVDEGEANRMTSDQAGEAIERIKKERGW